MVSHTLSTPFNSRMCQYNVAQGTGDLLRPPRDHLTHLDPVETSEVGVVWRTLLGYMYTLYITYARADDLSQTKEGPQKGVLCTKRGVLRGPKRSKGSTLITSGGFHPKWSHT